ncbi:MAG: NUDIX domain-containing protein [Lachnospiraceae bacterium]|nr:NUDIX domain-containing protein [Lachnospiraceae bacterium]
MIQVSFFDNVDDSLLKFAVIIAKADGKWVYCKHKERDTYENPGGHREEGETILATAKRELMEETGALEFLIKPVCAYSVAGKTGVNEAGEESFGMLYYAEIMKFSGQLDSEMEKIVLFDEIPENQTYPLIHPKLIEEAKRRNIFDENITGESLFKDRKSFLYGTGNPAKLEAMQRRLNPLGIDIIGLKDVQIELPDIIEDGITPLENARKKALAYYEVLHIPVFSCDSGLYIDNIPEEEQPGVHVRTIGGKYLSDDEMIEYYTGLAKKYGDLTAKYRNAICFVMDEETVYEAMEESMASETFIITSKQHSACKKGFPLDSISIDRKTGKYYYDLDESELDQVAVEDGFLEFFKKILVK